MVPKRLEIPSGADVTLIFRLHNRRTGDPLDLTDLNKVLLTLTARDRSLSTFTNASIPAIKAESTYAGVIYTAVTAGKTGDAIILVFNGTLTIAQVITAWNTANPSNQVSSNASTPSITVPAAGTLQLVGGYDTYAQISVSGNPLLGKIQLVLTQQDTLNLRIGNNQSMNIKVDFGVGGPRKAGSYQNMVDVLE